MGHGDMEKAEKAICIHCRRVFRNGNRNGREEYFTCTACEKAIEKAEIYHMSWTGNGGAYA